MRIGLDLDGTLISCMQKQTALMKALLSAHQVSIDVNKYWSFKRDGMNNIQALKSCQIDEAFARCLNQQWVEQVEAVQWMELDSVIDGAVEFLKNEIQHGNTLHLVSARNNKANSILQINKLGLARYFDTVDFVSSNLGEDKKSAFCSRNIDVYIGDTEQDFFQAQQFGIPCYLVSTGMRTSSRLKECANVVFNCLGQIGELNEAG